MHTVFNKVPNIVYDKTAYIALFEEGYALPIETQDNATVLLFKDVDDHVDGNGLSILWMLDGEGTFFYDGNAVALKTGDAIVFDDNTEHGFESGNYCLAVNFDMSLVKECSTNVVNETLNAFIKRHHTHPKFSSPAPDF